MMRLERLKIDLEIVRGKKVFFIVDFRQHKYPSVAMTFLGRYRYRTKLTRAIEVSGLGGI